MSLKIDKLSFRYGNTWVLRDLDLDIKPGMIFGICGSTASGKSTLLNLLAGKLKPSSGSVNLSSENVTTNGPESPKVKVICLGMDKGLLGSFRSSRVSTGEEQISLIKSGLSGDHNILILDDPFGSVDRQHVFELLREIRIWARTASRYVIFASSNFETLALAADQMAILEKGSITQSGTPLDVYDNPATSGAAILTGMTNLIAARRLSSTNAEIPEFQTLKGSHRLRIRSTKKERLGPINKDRMLSIRPEQITMSMGASFPEDNLLRAVVTDITFTGFSSLIGFDASGLRLEMRVSRVVGLNVGDECMLGLPPDRLLVL